MLCPEHLGVESATGELRKPATQALGDLSWEKGTADPNPPRSGFTQTLRCEAPVSVMIAVVAIVVLVRAIIAIVIAVVLAAIGRITLAIGVIPAVLAEAIVADADAAIVAVEAAAIRGVATVIPAVSALVAIAIVALVAIAIVAFAITAVVVVVIAAAIIGITVPIIIVSAVLAIGVDADAGAVAADIDAEAGRLCRHGAKRGGRQSDRTERCCFQCFHERDSFCVCVPAVHHCGNAREAVMRAVHASLFEKGPFAAGDIKKGASHNPHPVRFAKAISHRTTRRFSAAPVNHQRAITNSRDRGPKTRHHRTAAQERR